MGSSRPRNDTRAGKARSVKPLPRSRRMPAPKPAGPAMAATDTLRRERERLHPAAGALRQIHHQLDVANSVISLCVAVLQAQMADYDSDIAAALTHCVGDILDAQMLRITTLIEGGAS